jgi:hypothetical protein
VRKVAGGAEGQAVMHHISHLRAAFDEGNLPACVWPPQPRCSVGCNAAA